MTSTFSTTLEPSSWATAARMALRPCPLFPCLLHPMIPQAPSGLFSECPCSFSRPGVLNADGLKLPVWDLGLEVEGDRWHNGRIRS